MNKLYILKSAFAIFFSVLLIVSCQNNPNKPLILHNKTSIAITKAHGSSGYEQYKKWLLELDSNLIIIDLYGLDIDSIENIMETIDALLISGGPDVNPKLYGEDSMHYLCEVPDDYRDSLEIRSIDYAFKNKLAILGICRGQQILNIYFKGSLINDLPSQTNSLISHRGDTSVAFHNINIVGQSYLNSLYTNDSAWVNSAHHQSVKKLGMGLKAYAYANDSIIESFGLQDTNYPNFFLAVQFHPEHLGLDNELATSIGRNFIGSANIINQEHK